ncbi:hypothetical protein [Flavobacterium xinjiangense]|uniref:Uncharacterized protein n=1 Tax=Flavobacterium xinjiangense TaxID=178356 RepID=A0A1M7N715_9FLAO|nr:hypothetical protein [Flavobacterium xinjiangense]SHM98844.1 hypothetical protein SAMN05216269_11022 [Flavobacterium xinjiangense]
MKIENTRKRFAKRILFERKILSIINNYDVSQSEPLYGLSNDAISYWTKNSAIINKDEIVNKLELISKSLQIFCDNSKNTFDIGKNISSTDMNSLIHELKRILNT